MPATTWNSKWAVEGKCQYHLNLCTAVYILLCILMHFCIFWYYLFLFCCGFNQSVLVSSLFVCLTFWSCFMNKNDLQQIVSPNGVKRSPWYLQQQQQSSREQSGLSSPFCNCQWLWFHPNAALFKDDHLRSGENKMQISACLLKLLCCEYSVWMWQECRIDRAPVTQTHFDCIFLLLI